MERHRQWVRRGGELRRVRPPDSPAVSTIRPRCGRSPAPLSRLACTGCPLHGGQSAGVLPPPPASLPSPSPRRTDGSSAECRPRHAPAASPPEPSPLPDTGRTAVHAMHRRGTEPGRTAAHAMDRHGTEPGPAPTDTDTDTRRLLMRRSVMRIRVGWRYF